ncbi:MAG: LptF/LptG family permease [Chloroflexi bacterium]|nr:LptF/LptG family permease [Chloroflexota bacterium]
MFYFHSSYSPVPSQTILQGVIVYELPAAFGSSNHNTGLEPSVFWTAERARVIGEIWILQDVIQHDVSSDGQIVADRPVKKLEFNLHRSIQFFLNTEKKPQEMTAAELSTRIREDERLSVPAAVILPLRYEYWFRWALPFACMVFAVVSAPLTLRFSRGGSLVGILVSFGVLFFYYDLLVIAEKLAVAGAAPAGVAAWLPNILFGALGIHLILREP